MPSDEGIRIVNYRPKDDHMKILTDTAYVMFLDVLQETELEHMDAVRLVATIYKTVAERILEEGEKDVDNAEPDPSSGIH